MSYVLIHESLIKKDHEVATFHISIIIIRILWSLWLITVLSVSQSVVILFFAVRLYCVYVQWWDGQGVVPERHRNHHSPWSHPVCQWLCSPGQCVRVLSRRRRWVTRFIMVLLTIPLWYWRCMILVGSEFCGFERIIMLVSILIWWLENCLL